MSKNCDNPLMWAHYAGEHTGICIGFEIVPGLKMDHSDHFLPVIYSDTLPEIDKDGFETVMAISLDERRIAYTSSFKMSFSDKTFQKAITTKPSCWRYEDEWRYVEACPGLFDWPGHISELIFGLKCTDERRARYIQLAEEHVPNEVRMFNIRRKHGTNSLERVEFEMRVTSPRRGGQASNDHIWDMQTMDAAGFTAKIERLIREEKYGEAIYQVEENLKSHPRAPFLLHLKGMAHGFAKQHQEALECFRTLTNLYPDVAAGWYHMSVAMSELGQSVEALAALRRAFSLDPNEASIALNLGLEIFKSHGDVKESLVYLRRAEQLGHRRARQIIAEIEQQG